MQYTRETAINRLLESYRAYFNITMFEGEQYPLTAICEFFEHSEKYVISRQASLWAANCAVILHGKTGKRGRISGRGICTPM